jgi:serine/threonine protein kinase
MKSYHHPNVLPLYTSFVHEQDLWMVTPFMSGGSILHIMKYRFPKVQSSTSAADGHLGLAVSITAAVQQQLAQCACTAYRSRSCVCTCFQHPSAQQHGQQCHVYSR